MSTFDVVEATIAELQAALADATITSEELVSAYLARIERYDRNGPLLNAVVVPNAEALAEARESDARRSAGTLRGPLDGIPYTAKDSYLHRGLTAAAGSPAFAELMAMRDAATIGALRDAGAICLGLTNMPPMANGGMQPGVYGRAESPYNAEFLTAAYGSGSSNGSGTATAASFAAFGLAEETWSSGRAPASNNALCAYTPSRGVISVRGNWPLVPTMDVVVPHTRTMADLLAVLDVIVFDDDDTRGDFWRSQPWVEIPAASSLRPETYLSLQAEVAVAVEAADTAVGSANAAAQLPLAGKRFGVPRMYINRDTEAGSGTRGVGGPTGTAIDTRPSILNLFDQARRDLEAAGATVVDVDFPVISNYEADRAGAPTIATRGLVSPEFLQREIIDLSAWAWEDFLQANSEPDFHTLVGVDGSTIFPSTPGTPHDRYDGFEDDIAVYPTQVRDHPYEKFTDIPELEVGVRGLEETRRVDLEEWMRANNLDAVAFPAVADVGAADMGTNPATAEAGWRNGVWVANGNLAIRHLGIPTVTVPMGLMDDIRMPVGITFAGAAYSDLDLLRIGVAYEAVSRRREEPPLTPRITS